MEMEEPTSVYLEKRGVGLTYLIITPARNEAGTRWRLADALQWQRRLPTHRRAILRTDQSVQNLAADLRPWALACTHELARREVSRHL
jgi:hypothetical protein